MLRESNTPEDKSEMTVNMNRLTAYLICALTLGITACGEEEESNVPTILNANSKAECRDDNGVMKLELVEVAILHLDGAEVMGSAQARVESSLLTMEKQAAPYQPSLNEAGEPISPTCAVEGSCVLRSTVGADAPIQSRSHVTVILWLSLMLRTILATSLNLFWSQKPRPKTKSTLL